MIRQDYLPMAATFCLRGEALPHAKLRADQVRQIRSKTDWTAAQWARHLGVHIRTIDKVRQFRSWAHVA